MADKDKDKTFIQKHAPLIFLVMPFLVVIGWAHLRSRKTTNRSW